MADETRVPVDLVILWHHHQPDYRDPASGRALLPWVRLHATKDYLDMARHLERHPSLRVTFNLVPSLLDQLDDAVAGHPDALFELLARRPQTLAPDERSELVRRTRLVPPHASARWPQLRRLLELPFDSADPTLWSDSRIVALGCWFLLAWTDPTLLGEPEAVAALAANGRFEPRHRDDLLAMHARLTAATLPAYRHLAETGQIELSCSPYHHPILPLLIDVATLQRARPDLPLPAEPFAAPEDAERQILRALARHEQAFGIPSRGMWPSEGSVSPEMVTLAARSGIAWLASDEGVLWRSLDEGARRRAALYRPWVYGTSAGEVALFFRDRELSDRIGFVYQKWDPQEAARDLVGRVRRIGAEFGGDRPAVVSIILDGENCWEGYPDDGAPFLQAFYGLLETSPEIRTRTPSQVLADHRPEARLSRLHSGSWIDADFHIWAGQTEKNRAWDQLARTRRALLGAGATPESHPLAWRSLERAEGSDWFWWFGDDHYTADRGIFDALFRAHLRSAYQAAQLDPPAALQSPIGRDTASRNTRVRPIGYIRPVIDGRDTHYYEWYEAGRIEGGGGGAMHRENGRVETLFYGFDATRLFLRVDPVDGRWTSESAPGAPSLRLEFSAPRAFRLDVAPLAPGIPDVRLSGAATPLAGAESRIDRVLELAVPFASLGLAAGETVELVAHLAGEGGVLETVPEGDVLRFNVPAVGDDGSAWGM